MSEHHYTLELNWVGDSSMSSISNDRRYEIEIPGKKSFKGSADASFHGDSTLLNPEDMLLSSLSSCHMMSYFYLCRKHGVVIESYRDQPSGFLEVHPDGSGQFKKVILKPIVKIKEDDKHALANELHEKASKLCFIANSCAFEIVIDCDIKVC